MLRDVDWGLIVTMTVFTLMGAGLIGGGAVVPIVRGLSGPGEISITMSPFAILMGLVFLPGLPWAVVSEFRRVRSPLLRHSKLNRRAPAPEVIGLRPGSAGGGYSHRERPASVAAPAARRSVSTPGNVICHCCLEEIDAEHIDRDRGVASCPNCAALFAVRAQLGGKGAPALKAPKVVTREQNGGALQLRIRTGSIGTIVGGLVVFVFFIAPIGLTTLLAIADQQPEYLALYGSIALFSAAFWVIAVVLPGFGRIVIRADGEGVRVSSHPLPFRFPFYVSRNQIEQFYCVVRAEWRNSKGNHSTQFLHARYDLRVRYRDGRDRIVFRNLRHRETGLYIEQELEGFLGIEDERVEEEGAIRRPRV